MIGHGKNTSGAGVRETDMELALRLAKQPYKKVVNYLGGKYYHQIGIAKLVDNFFTEKLPMDIINHINSFTEQPVEYDKCGDKMLDFYSWVKAKNVYERYDYSKLSNELYPIIKYHKVRKWKMSFGKHKGKSFMKVFTIDSGYSRWLIKENVVKNKTIVDFYWLVKDYLYFLQKYDDAGRPLRFD